MDYDDQRAKKIVFLNHCLLNVNARGPGVAFRTGPSTELIQIFLKNDLGMIQLPCCECLGWGGAARKEFDKFIPIVINAVRYHWFPLLVPVLKASLSSFNRLGKREAVKVADRMQDYLEQGYKIYGVVGMDDSPTCAVTKKADYVTYMKKMAIAIPAGESVDPVQMNLSVLSDGGSSFFMGNLMKETRKRNLDIKYVPFDPWAPSLKAESEKVAKLLHLQI